MKKNTSIRPIFIFFFLLACLSALAIVCLAVPQEWSIASATMHTPNLRQVLDIEPNLVTEAESPIEEATELATATESAAPTPDTTVQIKYVKKTVIKKVNPDTFDTRVYLNGFYEAIKTADTCTIRVVHYGDSQIEEDRISMQLRRALQARYGGGGVGLLPLHQTIPTRSISQHIWINGEKQSINQGPKRYLVYGPTSWRRADAKYGVMGQVATMDNELVAGSEDILMIVEETKMTHGSESYFNRIRIVGDSSIQVTVDEASGQAGHLFVLNDSTTRATIHLQGKGNVYGISLENDKGIMVDNIPMRGGSGEVFTNINRQELQDYFATTNTQLIVMQYGGNVIPYTHTQQQVDRYVASMRNQIKRLKSISGNCSILFIGPSDMCERRDGELHTYRMLPYLDKALRKMAIQEKIAYYSLYQSMGGYDSMIRWEEQGLAGSDYIHFTRAGADKAGKMLAEWIF